ncbi:TonB-dependent receptor [Novosphingobium lentum]|uniref:TonB-dependent receptor n=1 Tax=Novosphingobium lentum TaxID=145287 RepID=UPI00082A3B55|nr:TonB-dependent receptor [Novosphingobium lentum]
MSAFAGRFSRVALLATSALAAPSLAGSTASAQEAQAPQSADAAVPNDNVIIVTAQKRSENLQNVPISIQALSTKKLDQLNVTRFSDYAQQLPSVTFQALGGTPGTNVVYMRGVASGGDGNHSGSLPSVGVYLDEQPVTTIGGNLDVHIYDIARIESLSGPQGTLYGASSEAGTIRIITNKPSLAGFEGRVDAEVNTVHNGGTGAKVEGMINAPLSSNAALRVVGFYQRDAGFIDNVPGCRAFLPETNPLGCTATNGGIVVNNAAFVKKNYNDTETWGGRAALKVDLDDNWTVTPSVIYQDTRSHGSYGYDSSVGDLQVQHFFPEFRRDRFVQAALTIEGKIGNWDVTYAGAYLDRKDLSSSDYTDYAEVYDSLYSGVGGLASYFYYQDAKGNTIDPRQKVIGTDHFKKLSQELRIASPADKPLRVVAGLFYQRQSNDIHQDYQIANLGPLVSVNGMPGTLWLTQQHRVDRDYAAFGELTYDILPTVTATVGGRYFRYDNSLIGFFGFGLNPGNGFTDTPVNGAGSRKFGVSQCFTTAGDRLFDRASGTFSSSTTLLPAAIAGSPCTNLGVPNGSTVDPVSAKGNGETYRFNLTWKPTKDLLVYGTVSRGFRPGGQNRFGDFGAYKPDYLVNYELGVKATLAGGLLRINGAIYQQDWKKFQFAFLGPNSFTVITNGPDARLRGFDIDASVNLDHLSLNFAGAYVDGKIQQNLCKSADPTFTCAGLAADGSANAVFAPAGARLPITPKWKMSGTARYTVPMGAAKVYGQVNATYQGSAPSDLRTAIAAAQGQLDAFGQVNLALGSEWERYSIEFFVANVADERGQLSKFVECGACTRTYIVPVTPRTFGVRVGGKF